MRSQRLWIIGSAIICVLVIGILLVEHFLDADTYRPRIQAALSTSLRRPVQLGHLSFSLLSGNLVAESASIADDPAFSPQPFLTAKGIHIGVQTGALLFLPGDTHHRPHHGRTHHRARSQPERRLELLQPRRRVEAQPK